MQTSAARNCVRSQKTQSLSRIRAFSRTPAVERISPDPLTQTPLSDLLIQTLLSDLLGRHEMHGKKHTESRSSHSTRHLALLGVLLVAQLMVILDITAVNIALPSLARDLQLSGSTVSWTITSYSLIFGSLLL